MSSLVVVSYPHEHQADEVRLRLLQMQKEYLVDLEDAAIAVRKENGKIKLRQLYNLTGAGAISGGFWGLLVGLLFLNPLLGAAVGAGAGAVSGALADVGVNDRFMKEMAERLQPGGSMLFILFRSISLDKALKELEGTGGTIIRTSLSHEDEDRLRAALAQGSDDDIPDEKSDGNKTSGGKPAEIDPSHVQTSKPQWHDLPVKHTENKHPACSAPDGPAYYNNTFETAPSDRTEHDAVYGTPSQEALKAEGVTSRNAPQPRRCSNDAEAAISRNSSSNSNLHCEL